MRAKFKLKMPDFFNNRGKAKEEKFADRLNDISAEAREYWISLVDQNLDTTAELYKKGIRVQRYGNTVQMKLVGKVAVDLETGYDSFKLKPGFLGSPKAKVTDDGIRYIIIPIEEKGSPIRFRALSDTSSALWIHPGFEGVNLFDSVREQLRDVIIPKNLKSRRARRR